MRDDLVMRLWGLHRRGLSYASDTPAVNLLLADMAEGLEQAAKALTTAPRETEGAVAWRWRYRGGEGTPWYYTAFPPSDSSSNTEVEPLYAAPTRHEGKLVEALKAVDEMFSQPGRINKNAVRDKVREALASIDEVKP